MDKDVIKKPEMYAITSNPEVNRRSKERYMRELKEYEEKLRGDSGEECRK